MPVGFQSWGQNNQFIQLDADYRGIRKIDSGVVFANTPFAQAFGLTNGLNTPGNTFVTYMYGTAVVNCDFPVVAVRCGVPVIVAMRNNGGNSWVFFFITQGAANVEWWVFNELVPNPSRLGFQIFKNNGQLAFDSGDSPAKVMGYFAIPATFGGPSLYGGEAVLADFGRGNFAAVMGNWHCTKFVGSTFVSGQTRSGTWMRGLGVRMAGNQLVAGHYVFASLVGGTTNLFPRSAYAGISCTVMDLDRL